MEDLLDNSNYNIFDIDNIDDIYLNNLTYSNGFNNNKINNNNTFYIKKKIKNSIKKKSFNNEDMITKSFRHPLDSNKDLLGIETIQIYNIKPSESKDKLKNENIGYEYHTFINNENVKNTLNNSYNNKNNASIDEINISLKNLNKRACESKNSILKKKKNNNISRNKKNNTNKFNKNSFFSNKSDAKSNTIYKSKKVNNGDKEKIILLNKIIYKQNSYIKNLLEQNKNLIRKIKKMHEENESILQIIKNLKLEILQNNNEKIERNDKNINKSLDKIEKAINSEKMIYSLYDNKNILCYKFSINEFNLIPIYNKEFQNNFNKDINTLYLFSFLKEKFYAIIGNNNDIFFIYNLKSNTTEKHLKMNHNHTYGSLLLIGEKDDDKLICLGGKYTKKIEIYNDGKESWDDNIIEEMPEERGNSCYLLLNNNYIYGFYGYNYKLNKYLNDVIYYDIKNKKWNKILKNSLFNEERGIKNHFCYENKKEKVIYILGGNANFKKMVIDLEKEKIVKMDSCINNQYIFNGNYLYNIENDNFAIFDIHYNIHIFNFLFDENHIISFNLK